MIGSEIEFYEPIPNHDNDYRPKAQYTYLNNKKLLVKSFYPNGEEAQFNVEYYLLTNIGTCRFNG